MDMKPFEVTTSVVEGISTQCLVEWFTLTTPTGDVVATVRAGALGGVGQIIVDVATEEVDHFHVDVRRIVEQIVMQVAASKLPPYRQARLKRELTVTSKKGPPGKE